MTWSKPAPTPKEIERAQAAVTEAQEKLTTLREEVGRIATELKALDQRKRDLHKRLLDLTGGGDVKDAEYKLRRAQQALTTAQAPRIRICLDQVWAQAALVSNGPKRALICIKGTTYALPNRRIRIHPADAPQVLCLTGASCGAS
jgi:predicted nuclease with TOPRIM domain